MRTQFAGLALAEITADRISHARDQLAAETFTRGKPRKDRKTGQTIPPKEYKRSGGTAKRRVEPSRGWRLFSIVVR